ncbi:hypothetical protein [Roseomonas sp. BN140053]|uniref:hypothetical protein n=1 Tax=Roseomonas sp. BN140053 TaxID=3391898 RepID=UPI0039ED10B3
MAAPERRAALFAMAVLAALGSAPALAQLPAADPPSAQPSFRPPWPDDLTTVPLNPPRELTLLPGPYQPGLPWGTRLRYPVTTPWPAGTPCGNWCNGVVMLELISGQASGMNREVWRFRRALAQPDPRYDRKPITPPPDYTEAWEEVTRDPPTTPHFPADSRIFIRTDAQGVPSEFVRCTTRNTSPEDVLGCTVRTTLDGTPGLQVTLVYAANYWPEREEIRAAVMELLESWR